MQLSHSSLWLFPADGRSAQLAPACVEGPGNVPWSSEAVAGFAPYVMPSRMAAVHAIHEWCNGLPIISPWTHLGSERCVTTGEIRR
jgi:hypothetical protein